jgi:hypothetical protein
MAGGLLQLLAYGQNNLYLTGSPQITHFKSVYKTHSNFSMESIRINFNRTDVNIYDTTQLIAKIDRNADLIGQIYLSFQLPDIISDNVLRFRWIENLAEVLINDIYITIGGNKIDQQNGEYMHILNQLTYGKDKRDMYDILTGNTSEYTNPELYIADLRMKKYGPSASRIANEYPYSMDPNNPSIRSRTLYIPLTFWFNKDLTSALPLISLQYSDVQIVVTLNPIIQLYKLFYKNHAGISGFFAPDLTNPQHAIQSFVSNAKQVFMTPTSTNILDIKANLEVNYVYLDEKERMIYMYKPIEYLITQVRTIRYTSLIDVNIIELFLQNPVIEIIWVLKRNDLKLVNDWFDFTDNSYKILSSATLLFNGIERLREKPSEYFSSLQPFQHHKSCAKDGIYVYSFSIRPEDFQPSGACNMSKINKIQLALKAMIPANEHYKYDVNFYITNYNILRIANGMGGVLFSL